MGNRGLVAVGATVTFAGYAEAELNWANYRVVTSHNWLSDPELLLWPLSHSIVLAPPPRPDILEEDFALILFLDVSWKMSATVT